MFPQITINVGCCIWMEWKRIKGNVYRARTIEIGSNQCTPIQMIIEICKMNFHSIHWFQQTNCLELEIDGHSMKFTIALQRSIIFFYPARKKYFQFHLRNRGFWSTNKCPIILNSLSRNHNISLKFLLTSTPWNIIQENCEPTPSHPSFIHSSIHPCSLVLKIGWFEKMKKKISQSSNKKFSSKWKDVVLREKGVAINSDSISLSYPSIFCIERESTIRVLPTRKLRWPYFPDIIMSNVDKKIILQRKKKELKKESFFHYFSCPFPYTSVHSSFLSVLSFWQKGNWKSMDVWITFLNGKRRIKICCF